MRDEIPNEKSTSVPERSAERTNDSVTPIARELRHERSLRLAGYVMIAVVLIAALLLLLPIGRNMIAPAPETPDLSPTPESTEPPATESPASFLAGRSVIVDAGHGGFDPGAIGLQNVEEAPLNLTVAQKLKEELESRGARVLMTRADDSALAKTKQADMNARNRIYMESGADIGVSIHMNKFTARNVSGPMVFYYPNSVEGQRLAQSVQDEMCRALERKSRTAKTANYFMLRESKTTSILVECGFLSNPDDVWLLQKDSHQQKLVAAIADGIEAYFANPPAATPSPSPSSGTESEPPADEALSWLCPGLDESLLGEVD